MTRTTQTARANRKSVTAATFDPSTLTVFRPTANDLFRNCVLLSLSVSYERGRRSLDLSDFGLDSASPGTVNFIRSHCTMGSITLLDQIRVKALESKEERARQIIREHGTPTPWKNGTAIQLGRVESCLSKLEKLQAETGEIIDGMIDDYDKHVESLKDGLERIARLALGVRAGSKLSAVDAETMSAEDADAVATAVRDITARIPSPETIRARFNFNWRIEAIEPPPAAIGETEIRRMQDEVAKLSASIKGKGKANPEVLDKLKMLKWRLEFGTKLFEESQEQIRETFTKEVETVLISAAAQIRDEIHSVTLETADAIRKNGSVNQRHIERLNRLVEYVKAMALGGDPAANAIEPLVKLIAEGPQKDTASVDDIQKALATLASQARAELVGLNRTPRLARHVDAPPTLPAPAPAISRRARTARPEPAPAAATSKTPSRRGRAVGAPR